MIAALATIVVLALAWGGGEHYLHRKTRLALTKSKERVEDLAALCDSQVEFLRDVQPIYAATLKVREETKNLDKLMLSRAEVARQTINRLRSFLKAVADRLDPEVAAVVHRNVELMMSQLPSLLPTAAETVAQAPAPVAPPTQEVSTNG